MVAGDLARSDLDETVRLPAPELTRETQYVRYKIKYIATRYKVQKSQSFMKGRVALLVPRTAA